MEFLLFALISSHIVDTSGAGPEYDQKARGHRSEWTRRAALNLPRNRPPQKGYPARFSDSAFPLRPSLRTATVFSAAQSASGELDADRSMEFCPVFYVKLTFGTSRSAATSISKKSRLPNANMPAMMFEGNIWILLL